MNNILICIKYLSSLLPNIQILLGLLHGYILIYTSCCVVVSEIYDWQLSWNTLFTIRCIYKLRAAEVINSREQ